jgi:TrbL/VirB6 plasmid conjugal transfer protein
MPVSLARSRPPAQDRAGSRSPGRAARWALRVLLITIALLGSASPALAAVRPAGGLGPARAGQAVAARHAPARSAAATRSPDVLTAMVTPALPGGVCQVPGIGDIGGLVGLCSAGSSGIVGDLNNICEPSLPEPEQANGGIDAMIEPPDASAGGKTLYDNYGIAGQFWAAHGLQCSDMTSLIGNNVAGMVFDAAKSLDRVTITVYQAAAGNSILTWLQNAVDKLISALGKAIYFPYLAPVVILGALWLAWQGLIRKRATRTIEGTLWMVVAATAAIALIGRPADFTGIGTSVADGTTGVLNAAFSKLPAPTGSNCLPVQAGDAQSVTGNYAFTSGNGLVDENANELWSVLVCKPWLWGELGTTDYTTGNGQPTVVNIYGRQLLWAQAIAANETPTTTLIQAKQATYAGIANSIQQNDPGIYPLFQGNQWTTRLEIAFAAIFAALVAGLLILLIALTLIVLKLGFLLLLVVGPFFLIVGTHPGFGRIIAIRWFEMIVGVLLKQVAIAIVLSVLLYCYSLIMGTSDEALPWALKILMIALVSVAVFVYRKPFTHLFSAVGYGTLGSHERAEYSLRQAGTTFRRSTLDAATVAIPGVVGYRAARWARRNPDQAAALAAGAAAGAGAGAAAGGVASGEATAGATGGAGDAYASRFRPDAPPAADGDGVLGSGSRRTASAAVAARGRIGPDGNGGTSRTAPPLDLPPRLAGSSGPRSRAGSTGQPSPAWPSAGWPGAATRQRPPASRNTGLASSRPRSSAPPVEPPASGQPADGRSTDEPSPMPFWLRPVRRDK